MKASRLTEKYRQQLVADPAAQENLKFAEQSGCILVEDRSYFYRIAGDAAE